MGTQVQDFSIELWFEIFSYLKIDHQFNSFFNLNKKLNDILLSSQTRLSCKNNDKDTEYLFKNILPYLTRREDIIGLRLESTKRIDLIYYSDLLHFPQLQTLVLHRLNINADFLHIFQHNIRYLRYLSISPLVSVDRTSTQKLLEMILSLQSLEICHLRLGISMYSRQLKISLKSSIKNLRLNGTNEICFANRLAMFLKYLPCLQSLHIRAHQLNVTTPIEMEHLPCTTPISRFTLSIQKFVVSLVQLIDFILNLTPYVQDLTIVCRTPVHSLTYLDDREWTQLITSLPNLKKLTLNIFHASDIDEKLWDRTCKILTRSMTRHHIVLRIGKSLKL